MVNLAYGVRFAITLAYGESGVWCQICHSYMVNMSILAWSAHIQKKSWLSTAKVNFLKRQ